MARLSMRSFLSPLARRGMPWMELCLCRNVGSITVSLRSVHPHSELS